MRGRHICQLTLEPLDPRAPGRDYRALTVLLFPLSPVTVENIVFEKHPKEEVSLKQFFFLSLRATFCPPPSVKDDVKNN